MSIPVQGRRSVLFPPPGVRLRRTLETQMLPNEPTLIAERDSKRVLLTVLTDGEVGTTASFAGSLVGLGTPVVAIVYGSQALEFWGPEEVWAECITPSPGGGPILVQSVFYD